MGDASREKRGRFSESAHPPCTCVCVGGGGLCVSLLAAASFYKCVYFKTVCWFPLYLSLISGLGFDGRREGHLFF